MLDECKNSCGEGDLQHIAKHSCALSSSNAVQLPKDFCRLAQHMEVGLPISMRQIIVICKMLKAIISNSSGLDSNAQQETINRALFVGK